MKTLTEDELIELQSRLDPWLSTQPGVTGTSVALGKGGHPVLRIYTHQISQETRQAIQKRLPAGVVDWDEGDEIIAD